MIDLDSHVIVIGTAAAPGAAVVSRVAPGPGICADDTLAEPPERLLAYAEARPEARFVVVVRHPFGSPGLSEDRLRDVEDAWVETTGNLVDLAERIGERCLVVRWEDVEDGRGAALATFLGGASAGPAATHPTVGASGVPAGYRPGRAARALAIELGYELDPPDLPATAVIRPADRGPRVPASSAQRRLLFIDALEPGLAVHHLPAIRRITGPLNVAAVEQALTAVVARHEALRTDYELVDGDWFQVVRPPVPVSVPVQDLRAVPTAERDDAVAAALDAEVRRPFDLSNDLKLRARLLRTDDAAHVLVVTMHHIASDGSSIVQLTTDMAACYDAAVRGVAPELPPLPVQYADFSIWQRTHASSEEFAAEVDYWRRTLAGTLPVLDVPTDRPRATTSNHEAGSVPFQLDAESTTSWQAAARSSGVTPFMYLLATYAATLSRWSGADDIVIGIANANRRAETEQLIGLFASTLPIRLAVDTSAPFDQLLDEVKRQTFGALANQDVPFDEIVRVVNPPRDLSRAPIFQTLFVLNNMRPPVVVGDGGDLTVEELPVRPSQVELDLSVVLEVGSSGLGGRIDYAAALFDEATMRRFVGHWQRLLAAAVADPSTPVGALPIMSDDERAAVVDRFASPATGPSSVEGITRLDELVALRVLASPDAPAFEYHGDGITYGEWDGRANQVARRLMAAGVQPGDRVGVAVARSTWMPTAVLGVLKCGAAYVPLDQDLPAERIANMVEDAELSVALTSDGFVPAAGVMYIDVTAEGAEIAELDDSPVRIDTADLPGGGAAWVIYTSGSTGRPKGVEVEHASAINFVLAMSRAPGIEADDVVLAVPTLSFDPSVLDLFVPAMVGARVVIASRAEVMDGEQLGALIGASGATLMQATPTIWSMLLQSGWAGAPALKVLCGGEAMPVELARRLADGCRSVWNVYGPTETTVWSAVHEVTTAPLRHVNVPIGTPIDNLVYRVVDPFDNPVPIGVPGEILIGGVGVARGYLHRPDLTTERFVPDPLDLCGRVYRTGDVGRWLPNGDLEFLGRRDFQVKLRGNRIELGEIEAALRDVEGVAEAVVVADGGAIATRLVAFVTAPEGAATPPAADLRARLQQRLPGPMIPGTFVAIDAFPLTASGKIDRRSLRLPDTGEGVETGAHDRPRDALEARLAGWFATVLDQPEVGIHDDFFDLGGHSLIAVKLFSRIEAETGRRIPLATLFEASTVAALAQRLRHDDDAFGGSAFRYVVPITRSGDRTPFFCVHGSGGNVLNFRDLSIDLGPTQPFYGLQASGVDGVSRPHGSIEEMAIAYLEEVRGVQPHGPYLLGGYSGGGLVAYEMAQQLVAAGEPVANVVLFDTYPPVIPVADHPIRDRLRRLRRDHIKYLAYIVTRRFEARAYARASARVDELVARGVVVPPELRETYVNRSFFAASGTYVQRPYPGRTTLIRGDSLYFAYRALGWAYGWDEFVEPDQLDVVPVAGAHDTLMTAPFIEGVAEAFRRHVWSDQGPSSDATQSIGNDR